LKLPLHLKSVINKGSNFSVDVPFYKGQQKSNTVNFTPVNTLESLHAVNKDGLILCIDNEIDILEGMQLLLTSWGYSHILTSLDGDLVTLEQEYKRQFTKIQPFNINQISLIFADYHLENKRTGIEVISEIRMAAKKEIPCVVITADKSDAVKKEIQQQDIFLLHKPIKPLSLRTLLNRLMKG
jgi:CheY-like chemotaxis protein